MANIEKLIQTINQYSLSYETANVELLSHSSEVGVIREEEKAKMPLHINVIMISAIGRLKETAHSSILQHFLRNQLILDSFVKTILGIDNIKINVKNVRNAEQDRIDVSIYEKGLCVIIENKVNDAVEQPGQIYRYVELALEAGYSEEQIVVLYLNSSHRTKPSDFSLTKDGCRIPQIVEDNLIVKDYSHDIYNWLIELIPLIPDNEKYLLSALHQYIDYLEEYFYLTDKYEIMKERIKSTISDNILKGLTDENDVDFSQRLSALKETSENLQQLLDGVNELIDTLSVKKDAVQIQVELSKSGFDLIDLKEFGYDEDNFGIKIDINGKGGYIAYGYGDKEYIGFAFDTATLTKAEIAYLNRVFKKFGKENYGEEEIWPCWNYIGETSLLNEFSNFVQYVHELSLSDDKCTIKFR